MQTPSHIIINAALASVAPSDINRAQRIAFVMAGILPDAPFALLTLGGELYYRVWQTIPAGYDSIMSYLHLDLFFYNRWWILLHNTPHSLVVAVSVLLLGISLLIRSIKWGRLIIAIAAGITVHILLDIFTHTSDGPLFLFPLSWTFRFRSPISYWEVEHYAGTFFWIELTLNILLLTSLIIKWRYGQREAKDTHHESQAPFTPRK